MFRKENKKKTAKKKEALQQYWQKVARTEQASENTGLVKATLTDKQAKKAWNSYGNTT